MLLGEADLGLHASPLPCPAPSPVLLEADQDSSQCNNASFMDVILFIEFNNTWYRGFNYLRPDSIILLLNLNLSNDCLKQGLRVSAGATHCIQHLHYPSSPPKNSPWGTAHFIKALVPPTVSPTCSACAAQGRSSQPCLDAHTYTGWAGRALSLIRRIANPHAYTNLCQGARQKQNDKSLNVVVTAFVLTKAKSKTSSEHATFLGINILSIFSWILKATKSFRPLSRATSL